ncbi:hypothetical protein M9Y10_031109 [Tritrichomonas musculus]|uniref:Uncharacterized protein n=1 Tax=Tritrichomonas musculus TaxID=1915356 RepID=A0ABR2H1T7_9EUKA
MSFHNFNFPNSGHTLFRNNVELTPSLWLYSIHSKNAELIHLLESNEIKPPKLMNNNRPKEEIKNSFLICLFESIKCHHNDFTGYIENNFILKREMESARTKEEIISNILKYHNYSYFQTDYIKDQGFFYLCFYEYNKLFSLLLKSKEEEIKEKIIFPTNIFNDEMI